MKIALYAHGGSKNHGCEALVRSSIKVMGIENNTYSIFSERKEEDLIYHLDDIASIYSATEPLQTGLLGLIYKMRMKFFYDEKLYYRNIYRSFLQKLGNVDLALAIGGDNYCYKGFLEQFSVLNDLLYRNHIPSVLWGCSIDPYRINQKMLDDLTKYRFITARESITYKALISSGLRNVHLVPDTAFLLDRIDKKLPEGFDSENTIGINLSPLIGKYEKIPGIAFANYDNLIDYIIRCTDFKIALIPHVVWENNDDRVPLRKLYDKYKHTDRILMIEDANAMELKGYIARCRFLIAARTHASIAGYSSGVPTLVLGYSVKARGIALDLFSTDKNYVIPVDKLSSKEDLTLSFKWLVIHEDAIRNYYTQHLYNYMSGLKQIDTLFE